MQKRTLVAVYLVVVQLLSLIPLFLLYVGVLMAIAMSFDAGFHLSLILIDIAGIIIPALLYVFPLYFSWYYWHNQKYWVGCLITIINWIYIFIVGYFFGAMRLMH